MKKIFFSILLLPFLFHAQTGWQWAKHLGSNYNMYNESVNSVITDGTNIYVIGSYGGTMTLPDGSVLTSNGINDIFIVKFDPNGNIIWSQTLGGNFNQPYAFEDAMGIYDSINNCIYIAGEIVGSAAFPPFTLNGTQDNQDIFIARMNLNGTFIWAKTTGYPGTGGTGNDFTWVFSEPNGDVLLASHITGSCNFGSFPVSSGGVFARYDSLGNCKWAANKFNGPDMYKIYMGFIGTDMLMGGFYSSATAYIDTANLVFKGSYDGFITRMDSAGNVKWIKTFGNAGLDGVSGISIDNFNNIFVAGSFQDSISLGGHIIYNTGKDILISKLDQNGNVVWLKQLNANGSTEGVGNILSDPNGNAYLVGAFAGTATFGSTVLSTSNPYDLFICRYDSSGECLGATNFGKAAGSDVIVDNNGSVYCVGIFGGYVNIGTTNFTSYDAQDIFFAKLGAITGISSAHKPINNNQLIIFANPNKGTFNIKVPDEVKDLTGATLVVNDNTGKEVTRFELGGVNNGNSTPHFDVTNAAEGSYTVKLITKEKKTYIGKLVVE